MPRGKGKKTEANRRNILAEIEARGRKTPIEFLLYVMWNKKKPLMTRIEAAKAVAPYVHRKQPLDIIHDGEINIIPPFVPTRSQLAEDYEDEAPEE